MKIDCIFSSGPSPHVVPNKNSDSQIVPSSVSFPSSSGSQSSPCSSPKSPAASKFHSPTQLLTSWLKSNSRKRCHSDSDDQLNHQIQSVTAQKCSDMTQKAVNSLQDVKQPNQTAKNKRQEYRTEDKTENTHFNGQKNVSVLPLRKRLCISDPLNSNAGHVGIRNWNKSSLNPNKENKLINNSSPGEAKFAKLELDFNCHQKSEATSEQKVTAKAHSANWLTQWSTHSREEPGEKSIPLPEKGGKNFVENTDSIITTVSDEESQAYGLQPQVRC